MTLNIMTPEDRIAELNLVLPVAPPPAAIYLPFKRSGSHLWIAGQIAVREGQLIKEGVVGAQVSLEDAQECARVCALNILSQVKYAVGELSHIHQVIKLNVFVASTPAFTQQHLVANGASELIGEILGEAGRHARSAVGVSTLPLNSPVEIDAIFEVNDQ